MSETKICGRSVTIKPPTVLPKVDYGRTKPRARYLVEGVNHPKGEPIRFKTVQRAENHIKNMGLSLE